MADTDVDRIAAGYDLVFEALPASPTFARIWREHALGDGYPEGFEHISFLTFAEMQAMARALALVPDATLVDLACGMGGPGLWIARETGARLVGVDISDVALRRAAERATALGMPQDTSRFFRGTFAETGLAPASIDAAMSVDALQYAPDKQAALHEVARILRPGARFVFACFAMEPQRVAGLPVFGTDPVADYGPVLHTAGFDVLSYDESAGWERRVTNTYQAVIDARAVLSTELGEAACSALQGEMSLTLQLRPYRSRILVTARKR